MSTDRSVKRLGMSNRLALPFAIVGFLVAIVLFGLLYFARLFLQPHGFDLEGSLTQRGVDYQLIFLVLCPPSLEEMALDNAGPIVGAVWALIIAAENAALYALVGAAVGRIWRRPTRRSL